MSKLLPIIAKIASQTTLSQEYDFNLRESGYLVFQALTSSLKGETQVKKKKSSESQIEGLAQAKTEQKILRPLKQ